jgi:hypothetical protein
MTNRISGYVGGTLTKGFVVGKSPGVIDADGSEISRPKLFEVQMIPAFQGLRLSEALPGEVLVAIAGETVRLDREAAVAARDLLNDAIEVI